MPDIHVVPHALVERLRRKAKQLRKEKGIPHHEALDLVARELRYFPDWHHFIEAAKATEPAERAYSHGLVIGMDVKDADNAGDDLESFIRDERLDMFVQQDFDQAHPEPRDGEAEWHQDLLYQTVFYRSKQIVPVTLEEVMRLVHKDFFFRPEYVRLRGQLRIDPFAEEYEDIGDDDHE